MRGRIGVVSLGLAFGVASGQGASDRTELVIASTTDVHGRLVGWDYFRDAPDSTRGLARAATIVDSLRRTYPGRVILLDAGDLLQGSPLTYVAARVTPVTPHPVIAAMNVMGYDAAAVGNHEFNYGLPTLRAALRGARFPFLGANVVPLGRDRTRVPLFVPSRIVRRGGVRVGIVGATTPGSNLWDRDHLAGRLRVGDIVPAVRRAVREVRRAGVDAVVVVMHSGLTGESSYDTVATGVASENVAARVAREVPGVDLIVFGHSHREVADTTINGVLLQQPQQYAGSVGVATLDLARSGGAWHVTGKHGVVVRTAGWTEHPAVVTAVARVHDATRRYANTPLGTTAVPWRADSARVMDTPLLDFINEVQRRVTGADLSATAAFDLNATLDAGPITVAGIARLYPYENTLRAIRVSGRQLREFLEHSARYYRQLGSPSAAASLVDPTVPGFNFDVIAGADYTLDLSRPVGERVTHLAVKERPVRDTDTFTMALNNYRQGGGGGFAMLAGAPVVYDKQQEIRELLIAEVQRQGELRPSAYHVVNWRLAPDSAVGAAYRAMRALPYDRPAVPRRTSGEAHLSRGTWLRVIGTSDLHGGLEARDFNADGVVRGGAASLVTAIRQARAECPAPSCQSIWVDGGDQWQGTAASNLTRGRPVTAVLNRYGLDAAALGNHEFDWGVALMRERLAENRFPVLAANMLDEAGADVSWMPNDTLLAIGGLKVGVIGLITKETARAARPSVVGGFRFVDGAAIVDAHARALRARGADAVVVVGHVGTSCPRDEPATCTGEAVDIARAVTERVDALVAGHSHRGAATIVNGIPIVQAFQKGSAIGIIDVPLAPGLGAARVSVRNVRPDSTPADAVVAAFVDSTTRDVRAALADTVGQVAEPLRRGSNGALGWIVAESFRVMGGGDVGVMNAGGVRIDFPTGPVTLAMVFEAQPFENRLVRLRVRGGALRAYLERLLAKSDARAHLAGVRVVADTARPAGTRLLSATMQDGTALDDAREYRVVLTDFTAEGADGLAFGAGGPGAEVLDLLDREALAGWLRQQRQPVRAPANPGWFSLPE